MNIPTQHPSTNDPECPSPDLCMREAGNEMAMQMALYGQLSPEMRARAVHLQYAALDGVALTQDDRDTVSIACQVNGARLAAAWYRATTPPAKPPLHPAARALRRQLRKVLHIRAPWEGK